jgi:protoporphyrinogen oxidase
LHIDGNELFPDNWIYVHSTDVETGRISNFRNYVPEICMGKETSIIAMEYWCYDHDAMWKMSDEELIKLGKDEFIRTGLNNGCTITDGYVHKIQRCYPVYSNNYKNVLKPIESYLSSIKGLSVIGRYGAFKYNNQDHSILMGILAADNIVNNSGHNLWDINTDYDNYQERSTITASGLSS